MRALLSFCLAFVLVWISHLLTFKRFADNIHVQKVTWLGEPLTIDGNIHFVRSFYNRLLFPALFRFSEIIAPSASEGQRFLALRIAGYALAFFVLHLVITRRRDKQSATALVALSFAFLLTNSVSEWVHASDAYDLLFCFVAFLLVADNRWKAALAIATLSAFNRESGSFAGVAYLILHWGKISFAPLVFRSAALMALPYAVALALRVIVLGDNFAKSGVSQMSSFDWNAGFFSRFAEAPKIFDWPALLFCAAVLVAYILREHVPKWLQPRAAMTTAIIAAITALFGIVAEPRVFIPCLALVLAWSAARQH